MGKTLSLVAAGSLIFALLTSACWFFKLRYLVLHQFVSFLNAWLFLDIALFSILSSSALKAAIQRYAQMHSLGLRYGPQNLVQAVYQS